MTYLMIFSLSMQSSDLYWGLVLGLHFHNECTFIEQRLPQMGQDKTNIAHLHIIVVSSWAHNLGRVGARLPLGAFGPRLEVSWGACSIGIFVVNLLQGPKHLRSEYSHPLSPATPFFS